MPYSSLSARRTPADDLMFNPAQSHRLINPEASPLYDPPETLGRIHGSDDVNDLSLRVAGEVYNAQQHSVGRHDARQLLDAPGCRKSLLEMASEPSCDRPPSRHGNLQHQLACSLGPPPVTSTSVVPPFTSQPHSNVLNSRVSGDQTSTSQPRSVKHLTCWYWVTEGCKLPEHQCLYAHHITGRYAEAPVRKQPGCPAVAGKNAQNVQPVYNDWRSHHRAHSAVVGPRIQKQLRHIHNKAALSSTHTSIQDGRSRSAETANIDRPGLAEMTTDYSRAQFDDVRSSTSADPYQIPTGFGFAEQPTPPPSSRSPRHFGSHFRPLNPTGQHDSGWSHHRVGDNYSAGDEYSIGGGHGGMGSHHHMSSNGSNPRQSSNNSLRDLHASAASSHSSSFIENLQKQMQVKDNVIAELGRIVEALEANYGLTIENQTETSQYMLHIVRSMDNEAPAAGRPSSFTPTKEQASDVPPLSDSAPPYGHLPTNHKRIITAMKNLADLAKFGRMALDKSNHHRQMVVRKLERIGASTLLPAGLLER